VFHLCPSVAKIYACIWPICDSVNFRNYARLDAELFARASTCLLGRQRAGQDEHPRSGLYLMATLRSFFAGVGGAQMIRHGAKGYFAGGKKSSGRASAKIKMFWSARERNLSLDGQAGEEACGTISARLRTVRFFARKILQLVKGAAAPRGGGFLDLLLAQTQPGYLPRPPALHAHRFAARKLRCSSSAPPTRPRWKSFFPSKLVKLGNEIMRAPPRNWCRKFFPRSRGWRTAAFPMTPRKLRIEYQPGVKNDFRGGNSRKSRNRERTFRATLVGPAPRRSAIIAE